MTILFLFCILLRSIISYSYILSPKINANINKIGIKGQTSTTPFLSNKIRNMQKNRLYTFPDPLVIPYFSKALTYNGIGAILLGLSNQNFLTKGGLFHSALLGVGLWTFLGLKGYFVCVVYLILGVLVTKVKFAEKEKAFTIDLKKQKIYVEKEEITKFEVDTFRKKCLLEGLDDIALTLKKIDSINIFEQKVNKNQPWIIE